MGIEALDSLVSFCISTGIGVGTSYIINNRLHHYLGQNGNRVVRRVAAIAGSLLSYTIGNYTKPLDITYDVYKMRNFNVYKCGAIFSGLIYIKGYEPADNVARWAKIAAIFGACAAGWCFGGYPGAYVATMGTTSLIY